MVVDCSDCFRRISRHHGTVVDLGSGTSGALLHDFHAAPVEKLAGERRVHYCWILSRVGPALHRKFPGMEVAAKLADDPGDSSVDLDSDLYGLSFRACKSARPVAESAAATAFAGSSVVARV